MMASKEDGVLIVQLLQWAAQINLMEAANAVFSDEFDTEKATASDQEVGTLLEFGEAVGTLVKHGLLNRELVLDMWAVPMTWDRVASAARRERERLGEPAFYENFQALAES